MARVKGRYGFQFVQFPIQHRNLSKLRQASSSLQGTETVDLLWLNILLILTFEVRSQTTLISPRCLHIIIMPGAMTRSLFSQLLLANCVFAITQNCVFKTGVAERYVPCDPNASQGTCCADGETCLESGLCYGGLGLVYRGACLNAWSSSGCVTYCDDSKLDREELCLSWSLPYADSRVF